MGKLTEEAEKEKPKAPGGIYLYYRKTRVDIWKEKNPDDDRPFKEIARIVTKDYNNLSEKEREALEKEHK